MKKLRWLCGIALMLALSACGQVKNETEYLSKVDDVKEYEDDKLKKAVEGRSGAYESVYAKLGNVAEDDNPVIVQMKFR